MKQLFSDDIQNQYISTERLQTATVGELIDLLFSYPPGMPLAYTWESQLKPVRLNLITVISEHYNPNLKESALILDAET